MPIDVFLERGDPLAVLAHQLFWAAALFALGRAGARHPAAGGAGRLSGGQRVGRGGTCARVVYARIVASRIRSQLAYPVSFALDVFSQLLGQSIELPRHPGDLHPGHVAGRVLGGRGRADLRAGRHGVRVGRPRRRPGGGAARLHPHRRVRRDPAAPARRPRPAALGRRPAAPGRPGRGRAGHAGLGVARRRVDAAAGGGRRRRPAGGRGAALGDLDRGELRVVLAGRRARGGQLGDLRLRLRHLLPHHRLRALAAADHVLRRARRVRRVLPGAGAHRAARSARASPTSCATAPRSSRRPWSGSPRSSGAPGCAATRGRGRDRRNRGPDQDVRRGAAEAGDGRRGRDADHRGGRGGRLPRPERGGQVHHDQDADRRAGADRGPGPGVRARPGARAARARPAHRRRVRAAQPALVGPAAAGELRPARRHPPGALLRSASTSASSCST